MSQFKQDISQEAILAAYLDDRYGQIHLNFTRFNDADAQHRGIDLMATHQGIDFRIDEKAQLHYINTSLPTFAFELFYLLHSKWHQGWLFDPNKATEGYHLVFDIQLKEGLSTLSHKDEITGCEVIFVDRKILQEKLKAIGLNQERIQLLDHTARKAGTSGRIPIQGIKDIYLYYTTHLIEKPVNLVIRKELLSQWGQRII